MTIYTVNHKAYVEIYPDYLLRLGEEKDVLKLNASQIWQLVQSIVATKKAMREETGIEEEN